MSEYQALSCQWATSPFHLITMLSGKCDPLFEGFQGTKTPTNRLPCAPASNWLPNTVRIGFNRPTGLIPGIRMRAMPELTRRRYPERQDCWHVYYGDVHVGTISRRVGNPHDTDPWEWICGFYPGCEPGEHQNATSATFDQARADFEAAWAILLPNRSEADFQAWRDQRDWTDRKYAMWARGERSPSQKPNSMMHCPCGERFDSHDPAGSYVHRGHIYAAQAADGIRR